MIHLPISPRNNQPINQSTSTHETKESTAEQPLTNQFIAGLHFIHDFTDVVHSVGWHRCCFSGNSELIIAARSEKQAHSIHIFHRETRELVNILQQNDERLLDLAYHPFLPLLMACTMGGRSHMWTKYQSNDWAAFAPDFVPLHDNEEYIEAEDEFDTFTEKELQYREAQKKMLAKEQDDDGEDVDIMTASEPKPILSKPPSWPFGGDVITADPSEPRETRFLPASFKPVVQLQSTPVPQDKPESTRSETSRKRLRGATN